MRALVPGMWILGEGTNPSGRHVLALRTHSLRAGVGSHGHIDATNIYSRQLVQNDPLNSSYRV